MRVDPSSGTDFVRATFSRKGRRKNGPPLLKTLLGRRIFVDSAWMISLPQTRSLVMSGFARRYCGFGGAIGVAVSSVIFQSLSDFVRTAPQCSLISLGPDGALM